MAVMACAEDFVHWLKSTALPEGLADEIAKVLKTLHQFSGVTPDLEILISLLDIPELDLFVKTLSTCDKPDRRESLAYVIGTRKKWCAEVLPVEALVQPHKGLGVRTSEAANPVPIEPPVIRTAEQLEKMVSGVALLAELDVEPVKPEEIELKFGSSLSFWVRSNAVCPLDLPTAKQRIVMSHVRTVAIEFLEKVKVGDI